MGGFHFIYIIPPIISIYLAACLIIISTYKSRNLLNILFSVICFLWALTSIAYVAHQFAGTTSELLRIERLIHFVFCYSPFLHVLFFHKLIGMQSRRITAVVLSLGVFFSVLTFTGYYISGIREFHWGYIGKAGPAFYCFFLYTVCVLIYITTRVTSRLVNEQNHILKLKLKYALLSFLFACALSFLNVIPLSGYNLYPMGNFIFLPLSFLAYGILRYRVLYIKSVLSIGVDYFIEMSLLLLVNAVCFLIFSPYIKAIDMKLLAVLSIPWFYFNHFYLTKIRFLINLFSNNLKYKLKKAETVFIDNILLLKNIDDLLDEFVNIIKETLRFNIVDFFIMTPAKNSFKTTTGKTLVLEAETTTWFIEKKHLTEKNMVLTNPYYTSLRKPLLEIFTQYNCNIIIPMVQYDELVGIVLFKGQTTGITRDEVQFINNIKKFVVIALYNSIIYQNITHLKESLEEKTENLSREIIERQHAESVLIESEARYRLLAENITDTIWVIDIATLTLSYVSPSVNKMLYYTPEELTGSNINRLLSPDSLAAVENEIVNALDTEKNGRAKSLILEMEVVKKDKTKVWVELSTYFIRDNKDKPISIIGVARDISERLRAEEDKNDLESKLRQAQKMESIGILAGGIAHDFNNILMAILGYTQLALMNIPEESQAAIKKVKQIETAGKRAKELVTQILDFSRKSPQQKVSLNLAIVISEAVTMLKSSIPSTIEFTEEFQKDLKPALIDPIQIHQIIINLCTNAFHAMEKTGGKCHIRISNTRVNKHQGARLDIAPGDYLKLSISDTGDGIKPALLDRIFEPYFTTKEIGRGTGMGLAVVHGIVLSHNGAITVNSKKGTGTTFDIYIPANEKAVHKPEVLPETLSEGNEKILFIDDEEVLVDFTTEALATFGYQVTATTSPHKALELFKKDPGVFDLVITDLTMPEMTGEILAKEIHKIRDTIPVILCTGYSDPISDETKRLSGISDVLLKPLSLESLTTAIRRVLSS